MLKMDGISFPRSFNYSVQDGHVVLQYRRQMAEVDMDDKPVRWNPLSGPIRILNDHRLDESRIRLVPKKPIPLDGLKIAIEALANFNQKYMPEQCKEVRASIIFMSYGNVMGLGMGDIL